MTKVISRNESYDFVKTSRRAARDMFDEELSPSAHLSPTLLLELCERKPPTSESSRFGDVVEGPESQRPRCHACLQSEGLHLLASHKHIAYRDYYRMGRNSKRLKFNFWSLWKCSSFLFHICIALNISLPHTPEANEIVFDSLTRKESFEMHETSRICMLPSRTNIIWKPFMGLSIGT